MTHLWHLEKKHNEFGRTIAKSIIENYHHKTAAEMQDALKDIFSPMFETMLQGEPIPAAQHPTWNGIYR